MTKESAPTDELVREIERFRLWLEQTVLFNAFHNDLLLRVEVALQNNEALIERMVKMVGQAVGPQLAGAESNDPVKQWLTDANAALASDQQKEGT